MTDYEIISIAALRYGIYRSGWGVIKCLSNELPNMSDSCKRVMLHDLEEQEQLVFKNRDDEKAFFLFLIELREATK